jgi:hypothetical protein
VIVEVFLYASFVHSIFSHLSNNSFGKQCQPSKHPDDGMLWVDGLAEGSKMPLLLP